MTCLSAYMYRQMSKCTDKTPKKALTLLGGGAVDIFRIFTPPPLATLVRNTCLSSTVTSPHNPGIWIGSVKKISCKSLNHDNAAKFTGLSCKLHLISCWKMRTRSFSIIRHNCTCISTILCHLFSSAHAFCRFLNALFWFFSGWLTAVMMRSKLGSMIRFRMLLWYFWQRQVHEWRYWWMSICSTV